MKCVFKTNKVLMAIRESGHTITTSEGKIVHKKLASKPIKFQLSKKPNEQRKPTSRCRRCGKFSQREYCDKEESKNCDPETDNTDEEDSDTQTTPYAEDIVPDGGKHPRPEKCKPLRNRQPETKRHYRPPHRLQYQSRSTSGTIHTRQGFNPDPGDHYIRPGSHKG